MSKQSVWALISHGGKFLFIKRSHTTSRPGQWCPPGGGIHVGETPEEACVREVREEVGLAVVANGLLCEVDGFLYFQCSLVQATTERDRREQPTTAQPRDCEEPPTIVLAERECADARWVAPSEIFGLGPIMEFHRMQTVFKMLGCTL